MANWEDIMVRIVTLLTAVILLAVNASSLALPEEDLARGKLLYATHCISCHTVEVHWRDKKLVSNWGSLKAQVARWQKVAGLGWSGDDIEQVSVYLNATYYHFSETGKIGLGPQKQAAELQH